MEPSLMQPQSSSTSTAIPHSLPLSNNAPTSRSTPSPCASSPHGGNHGVSSPRRLKGTKRPEMSLGLPPPGVGLTRGVSMTSVDGLPSSYASSQSPQSYRRGISSPLSSTRPNFLSRSHDGSSSGRNSRTHRESCKPKQPHVSRSVTEEQAELNELLRLSTASTPFHQNTKPVVISSQKILETREELVENKNGHSLPEDQETLLNALVECDALSNASTISADMTLLPEMEMEGEDKRKANPTQRSRKKRKNTTSEALATTENILSLAQNIADQRAGSLHQRRGDHLLYIHVHTMIRSNLLKARATYGTPVCMTVAPGFSAPAQVGKDSDAVESSTLLSNIVAAAVGTSKGFVLIFDKNWRALGALASGIRAPVQAVSIASDCSTLACNIRRSFFLWNVEVKVPKGSLKTALYPMYTSSETAFDEPLQSLQHMHGMPYGLLCVESHTGAVHVLALMSLLGKPMFLYRMCLIPSCEIHPTTSVDTFPYPSVEYFASGKQDHKKARQSGANQQHRSHTYPPLFTLLLQQKESADQGSFWSTSSAATDHLVIAANSQGVTLFRACMRVPSLYYVIIAIWDMPRFSKYPPLVHLFAFQESGERSIGALVSCEGALFVVEVSKVGLHPHLFPPTASQSELQNGSTESVGHSSSPLRLRNMLPWSPDAVITGIWAVGNGSVVVLDQQHAMTLVDAVAGVIVEHHTLPHSNSLLELPVNSLSGTRAGASLSSGIHQGIPVCGVLFCTTDLFFLSATLLTWQERLDSMLHHRRFSGALEYIRELMLDVGLAVNGWGTEGHRHGEKERALATYMEIVSLSFLEYTLQQGKRVLKPTEKAAKMEKTVSTILSFCQHELLQRVFWLKIMGFVREYHEVALDPALLAVKHSVLSGVVSNIPGFYIPRFVDALLRQNLSESTAGYSTVSERGASEGEKEKDSIENLLLSLRGNISALQKVADQHHFHRLAIHITSFYEQNHTCALLYAIQEDQKRKETMQNEARNNSYSLAVQFLSRFLVGKTFSKSLEYPKAHHGEACEKVLLDIYTNLSTLRSLLNQDTMAMVEILSTVVCEKSQSWPVAFRSVGRKRGEDSTIQKTKAKKEDVLYPARFARRLFITLLFMHPSAESTMDDKKQCKEEDLLDLEIITPLLYKIITDNVDNPLSHSFRIKQGLLRIRSVIMRYTASISTSESQTLEEGEPNWRSFLPVLAQMSVLQYKNADSILERREIQQSLSEYFRSPYLRCNSLHIWQIKCHAARMSRAAASICFRDGRFGQAIDYYLDPHVAVEDPTLSRDLFDVLHKEMFTLSLGTELNALSSEKERSKNDARINQLRCAVIDRVVPLRLLDQTSLISFYLQYQSKKEEDLLKSFGGSSQKLLSFLEQLIESKDDALRGNIQIQNQYIELLCIHSPGKVFPYLRDQDHSISYDKSVAIQCSRKRGVYDATIYLLTASNRLSEALTYTCSTVEQLLFQACMDRSVSNCESKITPHWCQDSKLNKQVAMDFIHSVSPQLLQVLQLGIEVGRAANDEGTWFCLLQLFDPTLFNRGCSYHAAAASASHDPLAMEKVYEFLCNAGLALVMDGISRSLGSAPLFKLIFQTLPASRWAPPLPPVISLLEDEMKMYQSATRVAEGDDLKWAREYIRVTCRGVLGGGPSMGSAQLPSFMNSSVCGTCGEALQRRENGLLVDNVICLYSCGHGYHEECASLKAMTAGGEAYSTRCPMCVKKSIVKGSSLSAPSSAVSRKVPSEMDQFTGTESQYYYMKRVRSLLDSAGERTSALKNILSALPPPEVTRNHGKRSPDPSPQAIRDNAAERDGEEIGNVLFGMSNEEILRLFGNP